MHLVLPPREIPPGRAVAPATSDRPTGQGDSLQPRTQLPLPDHLQQATGLRFRGPAPASIRSTPTLPAQTATHIRVSFGGQVNAARQGDEQQGTAHEARNGQQAQPAVNGDPYSSLFDRTVHQTGSSVPQLSSLNLPSRDNPARISQTARDPGVSAVSNTREREADPLGRARDNSESNERQQPRPQPAPSVTAPSVNQFNQNLAWTPMHYNPALSFGAPPLRNIHSPTLLSIQQVIIGLETQLNWGMIPSIEQLSQIRSSLYQILDAQYQNPLIPRDGVVEGLISRLSNLYVRADQLRLYRARIPNSAASNNLPGNLATSRAQQDNVYLVSSPSGYQGLVTGQGDTVSATTQVRATPGPAAGGQAGDATRPVEARELAQVPRAAAINNAINQDLIQRRAGANIGPTAFARNARRIWLFIRLYFFCYLFSDSGTWSRVILVSMAVLISLLSETNAPQHFQRVVFGPIQRHLEGLVHLGGDGGVNRPVQQAVNPQGDQSRNQTGGATGGDSTLGVQQQLRRVERSVALFLASLVPGIGERHIEVQNAAEAALQNQERERLQEEEQRPQGDGEQQDAPPAPQDQQPPPEQENRI